MLRSIRWWAVVFGVAATPLLRTAAYPQVPCDFKGVSVGEKLSREQLMQRFVVKQFKLDPPRPDFMQLDQEIEKYGITGAAENKSSRRISLVASTRKPRTLAAYSRQTSTSYSGTTMCLERYTPFLRSNANQRTFDFPATHRSHGAAGGCLP